MGTEGSSRSIFAEVYDRVLIFTVDETSSRRILLNGEVPASIQGSIL